LRQKAEAKEKLKSQLPKNQLGRGIHGMACRAASRAKRKRDEPRRPLRRAIPRRRTERMTRN
jgi:hypothetical protein